MHANSNEKFYPPMLNNSLSLEKEKMSELSSTQRIWRGGLVDEKKDGRRRWARGGGWFMEIRWPGWKHTPRLVASKGGRGLGKTWTRRGPIRRRSLISDFERGTRREPPSPLLLFYRGSLLIHSHREIICILNAREIKGIALFSRIC